MNIEDKFERHDDLTRKFLAAILAVKEDEINLRARVGMGPIPPDDWRLALANAIWEAACWDEPASKFVEELMAFENDDVILVRGTMQ